MDAHSHSTFVADARLRSQDGFAHSYRKSSRAHKGCWAIHTIGKVLNHFTPNCQPITFPVMSASFHNHQVDSSHLCYIPVHPYLSSRSLLAPQPLSIWKQFPLCLWLCLPDQLVSAIHPNSPLFLNGPFCRNAKCIHQSWLWSYQARVLFC